MSVDQAVNSRFCGHSRQDPVHRERKACVIKRTIRGVADRFGIPRQGVLIAWILTLIFSFPAGVMLLVLGWAYVDHPEWFAIFHRRGHPAQQATDRKTARSGEADHPSEDGVSGVAEDDFEEPWIEELRKKFDDLEKRTGDMEGYVASGDYRVDQEIEKMRSENANDGQVDRKKDNF